MGWCGGPFRSLYNFLRRVPPYKYDGVNPGDSNQHANSPQQSKSQEFCLFSQRAVLFLHSDFLHMPTVETTVISKLTSSTSGHFTGDHCHLLIFLESKVLPCGEGSLTPGSSDITTSKEASSPAANSSRTESFWTKPSQTGAVCLLDKTLSTTLPLPQAIRRMSI